jgi:hypothetical protein
MNLELLKTSEEIRNILEERRNKIKLSFIEDKHIYYMENLKGEVTTKWPSVSKVLKSFYEPFDSDTKSLEMCNGNKEKQKELLAEWKMAGDLSTNMGSRVHFELEKELIKQYGEYKEVRQPIFECDDERIIKSDYMINAGKDYINLMNERGAVLLDTEIVLGSPEEGYTGQPDKAWLINDRNNKLSFFITDWKTNQPKNFQVKPYHGYMYEPFQKYRNFDLNKYYVQIPLYGRLLLNMLKGTKYENIKMSGGIVVLLKDDGSFVEYRVPNEIRDTILTMDLSKRLK